jgi:two-component system NtrC family sensor kinase
LYKYLSILFLFLYCTASGQSSKETAKTVVFTYQDTSKNTTINDVIHKAQFKKNNSNLLNLGLGIRTAIPSQIKEKKDLSVFIDQSRLFFVEIFYVKDKKVLFTQHHQGYTQITDRSNIGNINFFEIPNHIAIQNPDIYIHAISKELFVAPVHVQKTSTTVSSLMNRDLLFGLYTGALLIMILYNLFLYFSVQDKSYISYVFYILFIWLTQVTIQGFATKYFWPTNEWLNQNCVNIFSLLALLFGIIFTITFLNIERISAKYFRILQITFILTVINLVIAFTPYISFAFGLMQLLTIISCLLALLTAYYVFFKVGFKPAGYYLLSYTILIIGILIFVAKDYGIIPYNTLTIYSLQITSVIQVALLSFALADKINYFKQENETSQKQALIISKENERLILEQNVVLEKKVNERTIELQDINSTLNLTLNNLKSAQSQLVDAEKMAALGQLTAGIAHEINNPINFVTSNIKPLELDIKDLKEVITKYEEIDYNGDVIKQLEEIEGFKKQIDLKFVNNEIVSLLSGISDGAKRTAEIIRSLRNFSRIDESDTKPVDLNEGLDSTLVLIRSTFPHELKIVKAYGDIPPVECLPGKINQVFMNLITNAVQAIKSKPVLAEEEFLWVTTWKEDDNVKISIKDSGSGMPEEVKQKIFEPFYTTKDVGEGTGLGLSIVFRIIENHQGSIDVFTNINQGTEFIITLPLHKK